MQEANYLPEYVMQEANYLTEYVMQDMWSRQ